jgi:dsRNA-specific ribonuclease
MDSTIAPAPASDAQLEAPPAVNRESSPANKREGSFNEGVAQERAHKRQRFNNGEGNHKKNKHNKPRGHKQASDRNGEHSTASKDDALADLKRGLLYITNSAATSSFPDTVFNNAMELHAALFGPSSDAVANPEDTAPVSPLPSSSQLQAQPEQEQSKSKYTDLPPPFALPDPANFLKGPSPALVRLNHTAPSTTTFAPVPPMVNYSTTTSLNPPESTQLPVLPDIVDIALFTAPFTHTSTLQQFATPTNNNTYEPLEFLGDAYLELISTRLIHSRFPNHTVGQKAGLRELLVKNETLAEYSTAYGFPDRVQTKIVTRSGPAWTKILADVFEAYLACIIIQDRTEQGFITAEKWLTELWAPKIIQWQRRGDGQRDAVGSKTQQLDAKSDLNRLLVGKESRIDYLETKPMELMKEGNRTIFYIGAYFTGFGYNKQLLGAGEGRSKQIAGTVAATNALRESADIIRHAVALKMDHERQFKHKAGVRKAASKPPAGYGRVQGQGSPY